MQYMIKNGEGYPGCGELSFDCKIKQVYRLQV